MLSPKYFCFLDLIIMDREFYEEASDEEKKMLQKGMETEYYENKAMTGDFLHEFFNQFLIHSGRIRSLYFAQKMKFVEALLTILFSQHYDPIHALEVLRQ